MDVVGDDQEALVTDEMARHLLGGRADIDEEGRVVRDERRGQAADALLLDLGEDAPRVIGDVLDAGGQDGAAVGAGQHPLPAKIVEVLADGLRRHIEPGRQVFDGHPAALARDIEDLLLTEAELGQHTAIRFLCSARVRCG